MNYEVLNIIGILCGVVAVCFLITTVAMFFGFNIPDLFKNKNGMLEQRQIEEIRVKSSEAASHRGKVNVFEELEKKAKVRRNNTQSIVVGPTTSPSKKAAMDTGTRVLSQQTAPSNLDFVIEKNIMFVSTNEVI